MLLHENLNEFKQTIESTAKYYNLEESFIEKDYNRVTQICYCQSSI